MDEFELYLPVLAENSKKQLALGERYGNSVQES